MCGIFCVISKTSEKLDRSRCLRALSKLSWRGPDLSTHSMWEDRLFIGQSILSITGDIDSKRGEHLRSDSGRFQVAFNGEIYNHLELKKQWLTQSLAENHTDSEVLINLHEVMPKFEVPKVLDGMYGYTVFDHQEETLTICRDPQGEKSLYLHEDDKVIIISSEIRSILSFKPSLDIDEQALRDYFRTRHFMFFERTPYAEIKQLLPGQIRTYNLRQMEWGASAIQSMTDWIIPDKMEENAERSEVDVLDELDAIMGECVQQMIPERTFATVVSGGIDSSLVGGLLVKHGNPDICVAVNHVGKDMISHDLLGFGKALGRKIEVIDVDLAQYSAEIERCQKACGGPLYSHSFIGQSIQSDYVRSKGAKVLFGGEGADELFGGYKCYLDNRNPETRFCPSPYTTHYDPELSFHGDEPAAIQAELENAWQHSLGAYQHITNPEERAAQAMMLCDLLYQVPSVGLRGADLMSMMWSVETRSLFLRKPLIQFGLNLPMHFKCNVNEPDPLLKTKWILKKLFLRYFPQELLVKKQGFSGFPNESSLYLGAMSDYQALDVLGISAADLKAGSLGRETEWKIINIEHFLRHSWNQ